MSAPTDHDNVTPLDFARAARSDRPPPLSDAELLQIRQMLAEHAQIMQTCPIARRTRGEE